MTRTHGDYQIDDDRDRIDIDRVHGWLGITYWWPPNATRDQVVRVFRNSSLTIGAYRDEQQVAVTRVVSDAARFAWVADVFVAPEHRRRGLARAILRFALEHPDYIEVSRWILATRDAHGVYASLGFVEPEPGELLQLCRPRGDGSS